MKIKIAITDSRIRAEEEITLVRHGFRVITLPPFSRLSPPVASHTDMLIARLGDEYISIADYSEEASYVFSDISSLLLPGGARFTLTDDSVYDEYPLDAKLNILIMGRKIFCNTDNISPHIKQKAECLGYELIHTAQGYPACTVLKLSDDSALTADCGMAKALRDNGIDVTLIKNGGIELLPYEYGFIGGTGGVYDGKLYMFGDPSGHPSYKLILSAAEAHGLKIVPLSSGKLRDLGGILFAEADVY